jgi:hypothetical protein
MTRGDGHQKAPALTQSRSRNVEQVGRQVNGKVVGSVRNNNASRITSSSIAIAWSIVILVFFAFFNQYIAYYQPETIGGVSRWIKYPILTEAFATWLPILVVTLLLFVVGHIMLIYFEKYLWQETTHTVLNLFVIATVLSLLVIFPFDFTAIPSVEVASILYMFTKAILIVISVALGVAILVRLIRLIVFVSLRKTRSY